MDIQQAISAPRISFVEPNLIAVDQGVENLIINRLRTMGHRLVTRSLGNAHGLAIEYDAKGKAVRFTGGADPRGEGAAIGLNTAPEAVKAAAQKAQK
jgi:gamma-glutamyltranspeptidase